MARVSPATRESLPESQRVAYDEIIGARGGPIQTGPVSVLINSPEMAKRASTAYRNYRASLARGTGLFLRRVQR